MTTRVDMAAEKLRMQDPALSAAYSRCKAIHRKYDPAFYAGCLMLPPAKRPYVDSLYVPRSGCWTRSSTM